MASCTRARTDQAWGVRPVARTNPRNTWKRLRPLAAANSPLAEADEVYQMARVRCWTLGFDAPQRFFELQLGPEQDLVGLLECA